MSQSPARYRLTVHDLNAHLFHVSCALSDPDAQGQVFRLPNWVPGSYLIRDFAGRVLQVTARDEAGEYLPERLDKATWRCRPNQGEIVFSLLVHALDESVRAAWLSRDMAFINGAAVFPEAVGQTGRCHLDLSGLAEAVGAECRLATSMPQAAGDGDDCQLFECEDYRELIDHPVLVGRLTHLQFTTCGCEHHLWLAGHLPERLDLDRLEQDARLICAEHIGQFGGQPPMNRYDFLIRVSESGYGGLEHRASTALACAYRDLPLKGQSQTAEYRRLLGLISHEYYHLWNVKRIRPAAVADSSLMTEAHFSDLWAYEGVTSYYDNLALLRSKVVTVNRYLGLLAEDINRLQRTAGRRWQSIAESGYEAWIKLYRSTAESSNLSVSYYNKGALVALMLDLTLRLQSDGACNLDQIMREMARRYDLHGDAAPEHALARVAQECSGVDLTDFLDRYVHGCEELMDPPGLPSLLEQFGILCSPLEARSTVDRLWSRLGVSLEAQTTRLAVVAAGGAAQAAGLMPGDELLAINERRIHLTDMAELLEGIQQIPVVRLHYFRNGYLGLAELDCERPAAPVWSLKLIGDAEISAEQRQRRSAWLGDCSAATPVEQEA